jgi:alkylation response protein AidB-like acyl-CoA dehydrogenase
VDFELSTEQAAFAESVRAWVERECPKAEARRLESREHEYPVDLWAKMAAAGFPGVGLPEEAGGQGGGLFEQVLLQRELARSLAGLTWMWGITAFCAKAVWRFGVDDLRHTLVPSVAAGTARLAMAVTEAGGGTDILGALRTSATRTQDGWRLSGEKMWSTGALAADHLLVLARTSVVEGRPDKGLTMFLVPNPADGLEVRPIPKLGMRALSSCVVAMDAVAVPDDRVLGTVDGGWRDIMSVIDTERVLLAALCCGIIDGVLEDALAYATDRHAFGRPIGQFQAIQHHLADIAMWRAQSELVTYHAAWLAAEGRPFGLEADIAKVVTSEHAVAAADLGLQILGGMGYSLDTDMQRYWRDARLFRIGPVTNEVTRSLIARQLGMPRAW